MTLKKQTKIKNKTQNQTIAETLTTYFPGHPNTLALLCTKCSALVSAKTERPSQVQELDR